MAKFRGFEVKTYAELSASIAAGTIKGKFTNKQRVPFALKDPRGSKHEFYKRMKTKVDPVVPGATRVYQAIRVDKDVHPESGISQSFFYDIIPTNEYKTKLAERISSSISENAFRQISASIFDNTTFPSDVVMILAEDGEDGIITGSYDIKSGSNIQYSGIADTQGYIDWHFNNSSSFNTGATWSFANSGSGKAAGNCLVDGVGGNELHQFDATASFTIRSFASASLTGSYIVETGGPALDQAYFATQGNFSASRIDMGKFEFYEFRTPSSSATGSVVSQSSAGFVSTIVAANIFGDGDETQHAELFGSASIDNRLYSAKRELVTFPVNTVVGSGSFFHSKDFVTLVGARAVGEALYDPIKKLTLYWASGSGGLTGQYGLSGSISANTIIPDINSIQGAKSGSHIFLNSKLSMPASGGYYSVELLHYPTTLEDGNLKGGLPVSGTVHVAGDGMRGTSIPGEDYFTNPFISAHSSSKGVITAAPRWNGISFSNSGGGISLDVGDLSPGLNAYMTGSDGD